MLPLCLTTKEVAMIERKRTYRKEQISHRSLCSCIFSVAANREKMSRTGSQPKKS